MNYTGVSGTYIASAEERLAVDTSEIPASITLPSWPSVGDEIQFIDIEGTFADNALTIVHNAQPIAGAKEDLVADTNNAAFSLIYSGTGMGWQVIRYQ